jgi:hypothetical protein
MRLFLRHKTFIWLGDLVGLLDWQLGSRDSLGWRTIAETEKEPNRYTPQTFPPLCRARRRSFG